MINTIIIIMVVVILRLTLRIMGLLINIINFYIIQIKITSISNNTILKCSIAMPMAIVILIVIVILIILLNTSNNINHL